MSKKIMGMDLEKQTRTIMMLKAQYILILYEQGIHFHLTFVWKGISFGTGKG